ncbi:MaoC family dehydratase [Rhizobiaceae bacterium n13]|uniref:MaoC family dehydratase n=1 Tax=Ferirhizobium litorale TaxID=2927786 RepID=A0AAE3QCU5_9HYPH|nr:MaoC family dehydratase [Fererhizobium litorale]MDI7860873.1 MaoC family dehydratase [Fererhizobium litorale]MDI7921021.1 MaoC family dehydratase [Fererhizobium litorale]
MRMSELYEIGAKTELGTYRFTEESILHFATRFDPQPFHVDREAAERSLFGGLCASGWHTCAAWMKTFLAYWAAESARLAAEGKVPPTLGPSAGFRNLQWLRPVFVDDTVAYSVTLVASRPLASRPGWIMNSTLAEGVNQAGDPVMRFQGSVLEFE